MASGLVYTVNLCFPDVQDSDPLLKSPQIYSYELIYIKPIPLFKHLNFSKSQANVKADNAFEANIHQFIIFFLRNLAPMVLIHSLRFLTSPSAKDSKQKGFLVLLLNFLSVSLQAVYSQISGASSCPRTESLSLLSPNHFSVFLTRKNLLGEAKG